jgi:hypothetical protein
MLLAPGFVDSIAEENSWISISAQFQYCVWLRLRDQICDNLAFWCIQFSLDIA